jgi:spore coat polysaccharide biosynthesis protein SpsF (cytidylyltransferase family)/sialic acid synthase SpsE
MKVPYQIIEIANCHGGNLHYVLSLIEEFAWLEGAGIKFQPLHPDKIATPDFEWYPVYQQLHFSEDEWQIIIDSAAQTKEIWIDLFDTYGVFIAEKFKHVIRGIKLQPSILYNQEVINALVASKHKYQTLIINVSALTIEEIKERITYLQQTIQPTEIWLEVGFQSYPTELSDSAFVKIEHLKNFLNNPIVFADHVDGKSDDAIWLPIMAAMKQVDAIEKHVMHSTLETRYDFYSSIQSEKYKLYYSKLQSYLSLYNQPFINEREVKYLQKSIQIPILSKDVIKGSLIQFSNDVTFKRSGKQGMNTKEVIALQREKHVLAVDIKKGASLQKQHFKKATIATVIACRLKSTRLAKKALLPIGKLSSIEVCIQNCLQLSNTNYTILATSTLEEDKPLEAYTFSPQVIFHQGDPEDVIRRYLSIAERLRIDVIIRVTGDMPYVSAEITDLLLQSHFENGADYTAAKEFAVGTSVEIINTSALRKVKSHFPNAEYSEYMTWYFRNNPDYFKLNLVDLPEHLIRNYRLTLDYEEDLILFNQIESYLNEHKLLASTEHIFNYLDTHPEVAAINSHITLKYKTDQVLIDTLNKETKI